MLIITFRYFNIIFILLTFNYINLSTHSIIIKSNDIDNKLNGFVNKRLLFIRNPQRRAFGIGFPIDNSIFNPYFCDSTKRLESINEFTRTRARNNFFDSEGGFVDYYRLLSLDKSCSSDEIERKYNDLNKSLSTLPSVDPKLRSNVDLAYKVLSNKSSRNDYDKLYDEFMNSNNRGFSEPVVEFDLDEFEDDDPSEEIEISILNDDDVPDSMFNPNPFGNFFTNLFGLNKPRGRRERQNNLRSRSRLDLNCEAEVDLKTLLLGGTVSIPVSKWEDCNFCNYNDDSMNEFMDQCNICKGQGMETKEKRTPNGFFRSSRTCSKCRGTGYKRLKDCNKCDNTGRILKDTTLKINVPADSKSGSVIKVKGKGHSGGFHLRDGDLFVKLKMKNGNDEYMDGNRIVTVLNVPYTKAIIGGNVKVKTFEGDKVVKLPACSQQNDEIKVGKYKNFNHYIKLNVQLPKNLSKDELDLLKKIQQEND